MKLPNIRRSTFKICEEVKLPPVVLGLGQPVTQAGLALATPKPHPWHRSDWAWILSPRVRHRSSFLRNRQVCTLVPAALPSHLAWSKAEIKRYNPPSPFGSPSRRILRNVFPWPTPSSFPSAPRGASAGAALRLRCTCIWRAGARCSAPRTLGAGGPGLSPHALCWRASGPRDRLTGPLWSVFSCKPKREFCQQ